jgi:Tfp pilus assembly protein PilF
VNSARQHFQRTLAIDSTFIPARLKLAQTLERSGDETEAANEYIRAMQTDAGSLEAFLQAGEYFLRSYEWDKAEAPLKVALVEDPYRVRTYSGLSKIHEERLKDLRLDDRVALLKEAIRLDPAFEEARIALADQLMNTTVAYRAANVLEDGLKINPESVGLLLKMGAVELYNGNSEGAETIYQQILKIDSQNAVARFNLGVVNYKAQDYDSAEQNFRQSLGLGGSIDGYYYLGMIYMQRDDKDKACQFFNKRWEMRQSDDEAFAVKAKEFVRQLEGFD